MGPPYWRGLRIVRADILVQQAEKHRITVLFGPGKNKVHLCEQIFLRCPGEGRAVGNSCELKRTKQFFEKFLRDWP